MLQRQLLKEIHGCISTGKEANVYHAITETGDHRAIKGTVQKKTVNIPTIHNRTKDVRWLVSQF